MPQQAVAKRLARASAQRLRGEVLAPHGPRERARDQVRVVLGAVADQVAEAVLPRLYTGTLQKKIYIIRLEGPTIFM